MLGIPVGSRSSAHLNCLWALDRVTMWKDNRKHHLGLRLLCLYFITSAQAQSHSQQCFFVCYVWCVGENKEKQKNLKTKWFCVKVYVQKPLSVLQQPVGLVLGSLLHFLYLMWSHFKITVLLFHTLLSLLSNFEDFSLIVVRMFFNRTENTSCVCFYLHVFLWAPM